MTKKPEQENTSAVDQARKEAIEWSRFPRTRKERHTFARIHPDSAYPMSVILEMCDAIEQNMDRVRRAIKSLMAKEMEEKKKAKEEGRKPKLFYAADLKAEIAQTPIDPTVENKWMHNAVETLLETSVSVGGKRAKEVLNTVEKMNRQNNSMFGSLMGMMRKEDDVVIESKQEDEDEEDDTPWT